MIENKEGWPQNRISEISRIFHDSFFFLPDQKISELFKILN